jgi:hypothetical protein
MVLTVLSKLWYLSTERHTLTMEVAVSTYFYEPNCSAVHLYSEEGSSRCLRSIYTLSICQFARRHALEDHKPALKIRCQPVSCCCIDWAVVTGESILKSQREL